VEGTISRKRQTCCPACFAASFVLLRRCGMLSMIL
jgi:hypothetical protein